MNPLDELKKTKFYSTANAASIDPAEVERVKQIISQMISQMKRCNHCGAYGIPQDVECYNCHTKFGA